MAGASGGIGQWTHGAAADRRALVHPLSGSAVEKVPVAAALADPCSADVDRDAGRACSSCSTRSFAAGRYRGAEAFDDLAIQGVAMKTKRRDMTI
jgi:hypothetical protein